jgi:cell division protein FtsN
MSNQDYISRSPAKKKNNSRAKNAKKGTTTRKNNKLAQAPVTTLKTKLITLVAILLICAFTYGLWVLKTASNTKIPTPVINSVETKTVHSANKTTALPKPPEEKWSYVKDLENKKIEVGEYEVKEKGPYQMQCGSFRTEKQAQVLKAKIAFAGISSKIKTVEGTPGTWHKVVLGPYERKRLAEKDKHKLKRNNINRCMILLLR